MSSRPLRVLFIEDSPADAELVLHELLHGYEIAAQQVQTADEMREKLKCDTWDIVISDFSLPGFSAPGRAQDPPVLAKPFSASELLEAMRSALMEQARSMS